MGLGGLIAGTEVEIVGVEDRPDGALKVYLTHRSRGLYVLIENAAAQQQVRDAWMGGHARVTIPTPPRECIFRDVDSARQALSEAGGDA